MANAQDPFTMTMKTSWPCQNGTCTGRLIRETKDQKSKFLGQVHCMTCGWITDVDTFRGQWNGKTKK